MSLCPTCGKKGDHIALIVPRNPTHPAGILHRCTTPNCLNLNWEERATHSILDILASFDRDPRTTP